MGTAKTFFEDCHRGCYTSVPHELYELFVTAKKLEKEKELKVNHYGRPTVIEKCIEKYKLKGIKVKNRMRDPATDEYDFCPFCYFSVIRPKAFLNNLSMFYINPGKVEDVPALTFGVGEQFRGSELEDVSDTLPENASQQCDLGRELENLIKDITQCE